MIGRVILAALLAGVAAGLFMGVIQHLRLTPLILQAETFEAAMPHDHGDEEGWKPANGIQRTASTTAATLATGAGYSAILAAVSLLSGFPLNRRNGVIWGLCGFLAVCVAPAAGLSPELPGMPAADVGARQFWWVATVAATGIALYLIAIRQHAWQVMAAVVLIALPHVIGAPAATHDHGSTLPAALAASFAANSIAANAIFWALIGTFLGYAMERTTK
jgi:cobalt transporter subunit CbtA